MRSWQGEPLPHLLSALLTAAQACTARLVIWQETATRPLSVLVSFQPVQRAELSDTLPPSFAYQSFASEPVTSAVLYADLLYVLQPHGWSLQHRTAAPQTAEFLATVQAHLQHAPSNAYYTLPCQPVADESKAAFVQRVEKGLSQIQQGQLDKVVLARTQTIALPPEFVPSQVFLQLTRLPNRFVMLLSTPEVGTWLGCSPELLLSIDETAMHTLSLAGTRPQGETWADKEYQEQAVVNTFIRQILQQLDLQQVQETPLSSMNLGTFKHLKTLFHISVTQQQRAAGIFNQLLTLLHPTPALCGVPQHAARAFIQQQEPFARQLYGGYLGPCNIEPAQTRLYVNIRCMQLFAQQTRLFLGAGITEASNPDAEWEETCLKSRTLLDVMGAN